MQQHGKLCRWNAERGFGFIKPDVGGSDIFVHISAFPKNAETPMIGDALSYLVAMRDGKPQATNIQTARVSHFQKQASWKQKTSRNNNESSFGAYTLAALLLVLIVFVYWKFFQHPHGDVVDNAQTSQPENTPKTDAEIRQAIRDSLNGGNSRPQAINALKPAAGSSGSKCDGRTHCSQMTSCAEATYFLQNCPGVQMDGGKRDGVPCEAQWCGED